MATDVRLTYGPGDDWLVARDGIVLQVSGQVDVSEIELLHSAVVADGDLVAILDLIAQIGLRSINDLVAVDATGTEWRVIVRGAGVVRTGSTELHAGTAATWSEHQVRAGAWLSGGFAPSVGAVEGLPLIGGVVRGSGFHLAATASESAGRHAGGPAESADSAESSPNNGEALEVSTDPGPGQVLGGSDDAYDRLFGATTLFRQAAAVPTEPMTQELTPVGEAIGHTATYSETVSPAGDDEESESSTIQQQREVQAAASVGVDPPSRALITDVPGQGVAVASSPTASVDRPAPPAPSVPAAVTPPGAQPPLTQPADTLAVNEMTVARPSRAGQRSGPPVHSVYCPSRHPNPPEAVRCRRCGLEVPPQDATTIPRPSLGLLRLRGITAGAPMTIALDGPLILGRRPTVTASGDATSTLVTLPSPEKDISRSHLAVTLEGWHVLVTDLQSVNGTVVEIPGEEPQRLRPGAPVMLVAGASLCLADELTYIYEVGE